MSRDKFSDPNLKKYLDSLKKSKCLSKEEQVEMFNKIGQFRNRIVEANLKLVVKLAFEVYEAWKNVDIMDLIQEGNVALIDAVERYDVSKGYLFSTLATYKIKGAMVNYIMYNTGPLRTGTTRAQREIFNNIGAIKAELQKEDGTLDSVSKEFNFDPVDFTLMTADHLPIDSEDTIEECGITDSVEDVYLRSEALTNLRRKILQFRKTLDRNERFIWDNRIIEQKLTLSECQEPLAKTHTEQVRRLERKVLGKAKDYFTMQDFYDITKD